MRIMAVLVLMAILVSGAAAQTATPSLIISTSPHIFATTASGQTTRFDYVATAGSVQIANLLTLLFISLWGMFLFLLFIVIRYQRKQPS